MVGSISKTVKTQESGSSKSCQVQMSKILPQESSCGSELAQHPSNEANFEAMLKRFVPTLGRAEPNSHQVKKGSKKQVRGTKVSPDNDFVVRIVHKGGSFDVYQHELPASVLLAKHTGMCLALPGVFRNPHKSVLKPEDMLLLGHRYFIIPYREVEKLKRKFPLQGKEPNEAAKQETLEAKITQSPRSEHTHREIAETTQTRTRLSPNGCFVNEENNKVREGNGIGEGKEDLKDSNGYEKDYYFVGKDTSIKHARRRRRGLKGNKSFVPPLPNTRPYRGFRWKPRLPTIPELSP